MIHMATASLEIKQIVTAIADAEANSARSLAFVHEQTSAYEEELRRRQEAEAALDASEALKNQIVDSSPDCIKLLDLNGGLLFMNSGGLEGVEVDDFETIRGKIWMDFWGPEDRERACFAFENAKLGGIGLYTGFLPTLKTKTDRWWNVVLSPVRRKDGKIWRILAVSRDLTDRKQLELELRRAIAARDEFLSIASHELKTPVTSLLLQSQLRQKMFQTNNPRLFDRAHVARQIELSTRQIDRLSRLIDDMLDISRISSGRLHVSLAEMNLTHLVRDVMDRFECQLLAAGIRQTVTTESSIVGHWDLFRLEQVIVNLITNAIKYAPGRPLEVSVTIGNGSALLRVKDSGSGVLPAHLERIFQRFERVEQNGASGLGLGLYISRQIVEAHRGNIWAESKAGEGTTFFVRLPLAIDNKA